MFLYFGQHFPLLQRVVFLKAFNGKAFRIIQQRTEDSFKIVRVPVVIFLLGGRVVIGEIQPRPGKFRRDIQQVAFF